MYIVETTISLPELADLAKERFGDLVKAVVDIERGVIAVGCELHVDAEQLLLEDGSLQKDLWGINLYPESFDKDDAFVEFDSMINLRPGQGNRSRSVENPATQEKIIQIVRRAVTKS